MSTLSPTERSRVIRSIFLMQKLLPDGSDDKFKARLVAGGDKQNKDLYDDLSSPTVSTCAVLTIPSIAAYQNRSGTLGVHSLMRHDQRRTCPHENGPDHLRKLHQAGFRVQSIYRPKGMHRCYTRQGVIRLRGECGVMVREPISPMKSLGYKKNVYE